MSKFLFIYQSVLIVIDFFFIFQFTVIVTMTTGPNDFFYSNKYQDDEYEYRYRFAFIVEYYGLVRLICSIIRTFHR